MCGVRSACSMGLAAAFADAAAPAAQINPRDERAGGEVHSGINVAESRVDGQVKGGVGIYQRT